MPIVFHSASARMVTRTVLCLAALSFSLPVVQAQNEGNLGLATKMTGGWGSQCDKQKAEELLVLTQAQKPSKTNKPVDGVRGAIHSVKSRILKKGSSSALDDISDVEVASDFESRAAAADDWGHTVHYFPSRVFYPASDEEVANVIKSLQKKKKKKKSGMSGGRQITVRSGAHSTSGQSQCCGCVVMDVSRYLNKIRERGDDYIYVEAGAEFGAVYDELFDLGATTPAQTDWTGLTVGGVVSASTGLGPGTFRHGTIGESTVLELTVVTGTGEIMIASRTENSDLFRAAIGGMGQVGVITAVKLRTVPIPGPLARVYHVYQTLEQVWPDLEKILEDEDSAAGAPFDQHECFPVLNFPGTGASFGYGDFSVQSVPPGSWVAIQEYVVFYDPDAEGGVPDDTLLWDYFDHVEGSAIAETITYEEWVRRLDFVFDSLLPSSSFNFAFKNPHPWFDLYLPIEEVDGFATKLFEVTPPSDTPLFSVQEIIVMNEPEKFTLRPFPVSPTGGYVYIGLLRQVDIASVSSVYTENARLAGINSVLRREAITKAGGAPALFSTMPTSSEEWDALPNFELKAYRRLKSKYDPKMSLGPGISSVILGKTGPCELNGQESAFANAE